MQPLDEPGRSGETPESFAPHGNPTGSTGRYRSATHRDSSAGIVRLMRAGLWDPVVEEIDGRRIRIGRDWLVDFGSCNYLGFDLEPRIISAIEPTVRRWGTHPGWSRMLGSPRLIVTLEERLAELVGAPDVLLLPTTTLIHSSVIPALAGTGTIFFDSRAHKTIYDACRLAEARGAVLVRFGHNDLGQLRQLLECGEFRHPYLVCMDGVNSMTGNPPDLKAFARTCREYDALLYVDDAHGFGVLGERRPDETSPYGSRGNSVVRHFGERYEGIVLVGALSKAYSSLAAFLACSAELKQWLKVEAPAYLFSGPPPVASLATTMAGLDVNDDDGDHRRGHLYRLTERFHLHLDALGVYTPNQSRFPLIEIPLSDPDDLEDVGAFLLDNGVYAVLAPYPGVPREDVGVRIQVTAAHTEEHVDLLLDVTTRLAARFRFRAAVDRAA
jgi:8-amino-7-oxononanoate synthase